MHWNYIRGGYSSNSVKLANSCAILYVAATACTFLLKLILASVNYKKTM